MSCGPSKQRLLQSKQSSRLQNTCALGGDYIRRRGLDELLKRSSSSPVFPNSKLPSHSLTTTQPTTVQTRMKPTPTPPPSIPTPPGPTPTPPSSRPSTAPKSNQARQQTDQRSTDQRPTDQRLNDQKQQADQTSKQLQQQRETRESSRTIKPSSKNITRVHIRSRSISPATPLTPSTPSLFHYSTHHQLTNQLSSPPTLMPRSDSFDRLRGRHNGDDQSDAESHISIYNTRAPLRRATNNPRREELLKAQRLQHQNQSQQELEANRAARRLELEAKQRELAERQAKLDAEQRERESRNYEQMMAYKRQQETMSRQNQSPQVLRRSHLRSRTIGCIQPVDREIQRGIAERWARINQISNNYDKQLIMPKYQKSIR